MKKMDSFDPDWQFAERHGRACSVGLPSLENKGSLLNDSIVCPCCHNVIDK
jgi:hypothetical protein